MREAVQQCDDPEALVSLDSVCEACMSNHVAKRASTRQVKLCFLFNSVYFLFYIYNFQFVMYNTWVHEAVLSFEQTD